MAAASVANKLKSRLKVLTKMTGDVNTPADTFFQENSDERVDMSLFENVLFGATVAVAGGAIDLLKVVGNDAADGTGTSVDIVSHALGSAPNAIGDTVWIEVSAEQMAGNRYATLHVGSDNTAVRVHVIAICGGAYVSKDGLTADFVA